MTTSPDQPIASGDVAPQPIERRLDSLADYVNAIDANLNSLVSVVELLNRLNTGTTSAIAGIVLQIEALHARLDAHNQRMSRSDTHLNEVGASNLSMVALAGRLQGQIGTLLTDVERLTNPARVVNLDTTFGPLMVVGNPDVPHDEYWLINRSDLPANVAGGLEFTVTGEGVLVMGERLVAKWEPIEETTFTCHDDVARVDLEEAERLRREGLLPDHLGWLPASEDASNDAIEVQELNENPPDAHLEADYDDRNGDPDGFQ